MRTVKDAISKVMDDHVHLFRNPATRADLRDAVVHAVEHRLAEDAAFRNVSSAIVTVRGGVSAKFAEIVAEMNKEFDERDGVVTCEFRTGTDSLIEKSRYLRENAPKLGYWLMRVCEVCHGYDPDSPIHVELVRHSR